MNARVRSERWAISQPDPWRWRRTENLQPQGIQNLARFDTETPIPLSGDGWKPGEFVTKDEANARSS